MPLQPINFAGVVTLMLCSCATEGEDKAATAVSPPTASTATTTDSGQQTAAPITSTTTTTDVQQEPAPADPSSTQSTSTAASSTMDQSTTGTAATPDQTSTTTTTSTTDGAQTSEQTGTTAPVTAADVKKGLSVYDKNGDLIGKVDAVSGKNAVVSTTGKVKATIPVSSFAKGDKGLMLVMTRAEIEAAAKAQ